jgi:hypothetical protein
MNSRKLRNCSPHCGLETVKSAFRFDWLCTPIPYGLFWSNSVDFQSLHLVFVFGNVYSKIGYSHYGQNIPFSFLFEHSWRSKLHHPHRANKMTQPVAKSKEKIYFQFNIWTASTLLRNVLCLDKTLSYFVWVLSIAQSFPSIFFGVNPPWWKSPFHISIRRPPMLRGNNVNFLS